VRPAAGSRVGRSIVPLQELHALESEIGKHGRLSGGNAFWEQSQSVLGQLRSAAPAIKLTAVASAAPIRSVQLITVGEAPAGFGKGIVWNRWNPRRRTFAGSLLERGRLPGCARPGRPDQRPRPCNPSGGPGVVRQGSGRPLHLRSDPTGARGGGCRVPMGRAVVYRYGGPPGAASRASPTPTVSRTMP
jgi:hypothetical protein